MAKKERKHAPKCEGRFGEMRGLFHETAREIRRVEKDPLWPLVTRGDISYFLDLAWGGGFEPATLFDVTDPYFSNKRDLLRGDPTTGNKQNFELSLVPFIFEAMRETLYQNVQKSEELIQRCNTEQKEDLFLLETEELTHTPLDDLTRLDAEGFHEILRPIAERDFTITQNSVYPTLLERYARLYTAEADIDRLNLFHRGVVSLDRELDIDMHSIMIPTMKTHQGEKYATLSGYSLRAEFGTGPNTSKTLISSAPYRLELFKKGKIDREEEMPVLGINFYLSQPDTMVVSQIQDIRGAHVPEGTTDGLCGLTLAEKVARLLKLKQVITYNHRTNPVNYLYPGEGKLMCVLKINFDEAARILDWDPIVFPGKNGQIEGYKRDLTSHR